jgi:tetratricopeptide (TPR) repeat protein
MYPYETPFGIIMKINRQPVTQFTDDIYKKDHEFWSKYSERFIGNWITYDTSVKEITEFVEKVYLQNNYEGFQGDPKFVRDDDGQKAFSKLRSSQAGMYAWRCSPACPPEYRPKTPQDQEALRRETEFAFKQAFAFCPYSPEAVYRYVNFLLQYNRFDDALLVAKTCLKLDPFNGSITDLIKSLNDFKANSAPRMEQQAQFEAKIQAMENEVQKNPTNFKNILVLSQYYGQMQQADRANELISNALKIPDQMINAGTWRYEDLAALAQMCALTANYGKLEVVIKKIVDLQPDKPEPHYDLAALQAVIGKTTESLQNLQSALDLNSKRLAVDPHASNLLILARSDPRFANLRKTPEYQKIISGN